MATITLEYDAHNPIARKTIEFIMALGFFEKREKLSGFEEAENDKKNGRVYTANNAKNLIDQCLR
jgi:hypothetical protein